MKIGITERGDAGIDLSWTETIKTVDKAILITKGVAYPAFREAAIAHKDKVIVHATITGMGDSYIEPNVPHPEKSMEGLHSLIKDGFPPEQVVLRIDPIIPWIHDDVSRKWAVWLLQNKPREVNRIRFSIVDNYKHIAARGLELPWKGFHAPDHMIKSVVDVFMDAIIGNSIECCGENSRVIPAAWKTGCVSKKDFDVFGISYPSNLGKSKQRRDCLCVTSKTELLNSRKQCPHGCLYCYWR